MSPDRQYHNENRYKDEDSNIQNYSFTYCYIWCGKLAHDKKQKVETAAEMKFLRRAAQKVEWTEGGIKI